MKHKERRFLRPAEVGKSLIPREEENLSSSSSNVPEDSESIAEPARARAVYWLHAHAAAVIRAKRLDAKFQVSSSAAVEDLKIHPASFPPPVFFPPSRDRLRTLHPSLATDVSFSAIFLVSSFFLLLLAPWKTSCASFATTRDAIELG